MRLLRPAAASRKIGVLPYPIPGTLAYFGYGATMVEPNEFRFRDLERTRDGFFGKLSYLFRF